MVSTLGNHHLCFILCCFVLLCFALRCFCCVLLCFALLRFVLLCCAVLCFALRCFALFRFDLICFAVLCCALICFALLCFDLLSGAIMCSNNKCSLHCPARDIKLSLRFSGDVLHVQVAFIEFSGCFRGAMSIEGCVVATHRFKESLGFCPGNVVHCDA